MIVLIPDHCFSIYYDESEMRTRQKRIVTFGLP